MKIPLPKIFAAALSLFPGIGLCEGLSTKPQNASYFCAVEFAGGLAFNERLKKWEGATFRPDRKFVLRLGYIASRKQKNYRGEDEPVLDFAVTITDAGSNSPSKCLSGSSGTVTVDEVNYVSCTTLYTHYEINLENNRFLYSYAVGYVDGRDNNSDTPSIAGGTCTKID